LGISHIGIVEKIKVESNESQAELEFLKRYQERGTQF